MKNTKNNKEIKKNLSKVIINIFNMIGIIYLSSYIFVGMVMYFSLKGMPIIDNIMLSTVLLLIFLSFAFAKKII